MKLVDEQDAFLTDVAKLLIESSRLGFKRTSGELLRTQEQQDIYLHSKPPKTQVAHSQHQDKLAIDLNFFKDDIYINGLSANKAIEILKPLGIFWESLNLKNRWGGNFDRDWNKIDNFKDVPHFERRV